MRKVVIVIGILILIAGIVIALFLIGKYTRPAGTDYRTWKTATDDGFTFKYPEQLPTKYVSAVEWPPEVEVKIAQFLCIAEGIQQINGRQYCVGLQSEGAAGSVYNTYTYNTMKDDRMVTVRFTLRYQQCANYDDPQKPECEQERRTSSIDDLADRVAQTVRF